MTTPHATTPGALDAHAIDRIRARLAEHQRIYNFPVETTRPDVSRSLIYEADHDIRRLLAALAAHEAGQP